MTDGCLININGCRNVSLTLASGKSATDVPHDCRIQLRVSMPAAVVSVVRIVCVRTDPKVSRIDTGRIVAGVKRILTFIERAADLALQR